MPDISMCNAIKYTSVCPKKDTCYRHMAVPNEYRQTYFMNAPFIIGEDMSIDCPYYTPVRNGDRIRKESDDG